MEGFPAGFLVPVVCQQDLNRAGDGVFIDAVIGGENAVDVVDVCGFCCDDDGVWGRVG